MKKNLLLFVALCAVCIGVDAQKIDTRLTNILKQNAQVVKRAKMHKAPSKITPITYRNKATGDLYQMEMKHHVNGVDTMALKNALELNFNADGTIRTFTVIALMAPSANVPEEQLAALGVEVVSKIGKSVILKVPANALEMLEDMPEFQYISASGTVKPNNDVTRQMTSASYVTNEKECYQIPNKYTGQGVVVGVVDAGIDFNHPAFRDPETGKTRIGRAVYFKDEQMHVVTETSEGETIDDLTTNSTSISHGSHTSATAAGSPVGSTNAGGMAPKADLVLCDVGNILYDSYIIQSVFSVFEYAESKGMPAVVNLSLGSNMGFHDGSDVLTHVIGQFADEGRVICVSAGNEANTAMSVVKNGNVKVALISQYETEEHQLVYIGGYAFWVDGSDNRPFTGELMVVDLNTGEETPLSEGVVFDADGKDLYTILEGGPTFTSVLEQSNQRSAFYFSYDQPLIMAESGKALALKVNAEADQKIVLIERNSTNASNFMVGSSSYPALADYDDGSDVMSINVMACTDKVLSVGSYVQRPAFKNYAGQTLGNDIKIGEIASYSSYGVDDNGKKRPDFLTPGYWTVSAYNIYDETYFTNKQLDAEKSRMVVHYLQNIQIGDYNREACAYGAMTGTSMACPVATGIVALMLQADPTLSVEKIRAMLPQICLNDKWTTEVENIRQYSLIAAGNGKLDALRAIKYIENTKAGEELYPLDEKVTISASGLATFSSEYPLNFASATAPKAYVASDYNGEVLTMQRQNDNVAAGEGLLLSGVGEYNIPIAAEGSASTTNYLVGTATESKTLNTQGEAYVLAKKNDQLGFYQNGAGLTVGKGKAYLVLPEIGGATNARAFAFIFNEEEESTEKSDAYTPINMEEYLHLNSLYVGQETGVDVIGTSSDCVVRDGKYIENGSIIIVKNGKKYSINGQEIY